VRTRIFESDRNRPASAGPAPVLTPEAQAARDMARELVGGGMEPAEVAAQVVDAIAAGRFYVLTHPDTHALVLARAEQVVAGGPPPGSFS
jgi:hypothetical protein